MHCRTWNSNIFKFVELKWTTHKVHYTEFIMTVAGVAREDIRPAEFTFFGDMFPWLDPPVSHAVLLICSKINDTKCSIRLWCKRRKSLKPTQLLLGHEYYKIFYHGSCPNRTQGFLACPFVVFSRMNIGSLAVRLRTQSLQCHQGIPVSKE